MAVHLLSPNGVTDFSFDFTELFAGRTAAPATVESDAQLECDVSAQVGAVAQVTIRALSSAIAGAHYRVTCACASLDGDVQDCRTLSVWILPR